MLQLLRSRPFHKVSHPPSPARAALMSLDALRGFDMFWIVGGEELVHGLYKAWPSGPLGLLQHQLNHKAWAGVAFYDLIFPLFVFIVGVSTVFSVRRMVPSRTGMGRTIKRILVRSLVLYIFGLLVYGGISKGVDHIRWLGVLRALPSVSSATSLLFCAFRPRA